MDTMKSNTPKSHLSLMLAGFFAIAQLAMLPFLSNTGSEPSKPEVSASLPTDQDLYLPTPAYDPGAEQKGGSTFAYDPWVERGRTAPLVYDPWVDDEGG